MELSVKFGFTGSPGASRACVKSSLEIEKLSGMLRRERSRLVSDHACGRGIEDSRCPERTLARHRFRTCRISSAVSPTANLRLLPGRSLDRYTSGRHCCKSRVKPAEIAWMQRRNSLIQAESCRHRSAGAPRRRAAAEAPAESANVAAIEPTKGAPPAFRASSVMPTRSSALNPQIVPFHGKEASVKPWRAEAGSAEETCPSPRCHVVGTMLLSTGAFQSRMHLVQRATYIEL